MRNRPFRSVKVLPAPESRAAHITWEMTPSFGPAKFYVYRANDGGATFDLCDGMPVTTLAYTDVGYGVKPKLVDRMYKVLAVRDEDGAEFESPNVSVSSLLNGRAYGIAHNIIRARYMQAKFDGILVLHYPLVRSGAVSSSIDPESGQREESATCAEDDYGTYYEQGYYPPFLTYVRPTGPTIHVDARTDAGGTTTSKTRTADMLHSPPARTGDLLVDVLRGERWVVGEQVSCIAVQSTIPVGYSTTITLQEASNPCYKVPIPDNYDQMVERLNKYGY